MADQYRGGCSNNRSRCLVRLDSLGLREGVWWQGLLLGLHDGHVVWQRLLGASLASGVERQHDLHLNSKNALPQKDVPAGRVNVVIDGVNVVIDGVSRVDHQAI